MNREIAGVKVRRTLTLACEHNMENTASVEAASLTLTADMGEEKIFGFASAGIEADNLGRLQLAVKMKRPLYDRYSAATITNCFAGFSADYHTAKGYTRRVLFALAPQGAGVTQNSRPWWGTFYTAETPQRETPQRETPQRETPQRGVSTGKVIASNIEPTYLIALQPGDMMTLDLGAYAPEGWDGRVIFGVALDSCGLGTGLQARITGNGPPGPRLAKMPGPPPLPKAAKALAYFQGVNVFGFEDGARMEKDSVLFPARGLIEATGLGVVTWKVRRTPDSRSAEMWINYQVESGKYEMKKLPLGERAAPGGEAKFDTDLKQYAPKGWTGRCQVRLVGDGVSAELIANSSFQIY